MVRDCARALALFAMVCGWLVALNTATARAQEGDPFGAPGKKTPADETPFGAEAPTEAPKKLSGPAAPAADPFNSDSYSSGAPKVAAKKTVEVQRPEPPLSTNELVRETLEKRTRMEFVDMPLQDAIEFLKDYHQIEIQIDHRSLEAIGVGSDTPVTRTVSRLPLKSALRLLLDELDLAYVVENDVLLITTKDRASAMRDVRVYDVTKLVAPDAKTEDVVPMLEALMSESGEGAPAGVQRIRIVPMGDVFVIRASQEEHEEIVDILKALAAVPLPKN